LTVAVSAIVAGVVAGVGAYYAGRLAAPAEVTKEVTRTVERTATVTAPASTVTKIITTTVTTTVAATTPTPTKENEVRIGGLASLTGVLAGFGQPAAWAQRKCVEDVNKLGGVDVGGRKLPVKFIQYDDSSDPTKAVALTEQLILQDKVHMIVLTPGPPTVAIPVSQAADRFKIVAIVDGVMEPWWASGPYTYAWSIAGRFFTPLPADDPRAGLPGYTAMENYLTFTNRFRDKINGRIALCALDDADGRVWYDVAKDTLQKAGYTIVGVEKRLGQYAPGTMDFTAIIREWMKGEADVLWGLSPAPDFATMWRQAYALGWKPKMVLDGRALKNYGDVLAIGKEIVNGLIDPFNVWTPYLPFKSNYGGRTNPQIAEEYTRETGEHWSDTLSSYSVIEVACKAIELAGSLETEKINEAMLGLDIITMGWGRIRFTRQDHNTGQLYYVAQWVVDEKGNLEEQLVYSPNPDVKPTREPIFPLP
jgi:branched-chain amino acid transport system substrate-binding protein